MLKIIYEDNLIVRRERYPRLRLTPSLLTAADATGCRRQIVNSSKSRIFEQRSPKLDVARGQFATKNELTETKIAKIVQVAIS